MSAVPDWFKRPYQPHLSPVGKRVLREAAACPGVLWRDLRDDGICTTATFQNTVMELRRDGILYPGAPAPLILSATAQAPWRAYLETRPTVTKAIAGELVALLSKGPLSRAEAFEALDHPDTTLDRIVQDLRARRVIHPAGGLVLTEAGVVLAEREGVKALPQEWAGVLE